MFPCSIRIFESMCGPLKCIFCELCLPLTCTPSGRRNSGMRRRRGLARVASCSPDPYASFEWMCGPLECIFCELCLPLTCTPSGRRNSLMRRRRGLARVASCSPDPYASFEWMCGPLECIFCELCLPLEGWLGSHRVPLIHTHLLSGCVAL